MHAREFNAGHNHLGDIFSQRIYLRQDPQLVLCRKPRHFVANEFKQKLPGVVGLEPGP